MTASMKSLKVYRVSTEDERIVHFTVHRMVAGLWYFRGMLSMPAANPLFSYSLVFLTSGRWWPVQFFLDWFLLNPVEGGHLDCTFGY